MLPKFALALIVSVAVTSDAYANETSTRGLGGVPCGKFVEVVRQNTEQKPTAASNAELLMFSQWIGGYMTAVNAQKEIEDTFPIRSPLGQAITYFAIVCAQNTKVPLVAVVNGSLEATFKFIPRKRKKDLVTIGTGKGQLVVYKKYLVEVQKYLSKKGYRLKTDGVFGPGTANAIQSYKKDNKLSGPATPDAFMLGSILSGK